MLIDYLLCAKSVQGSEHTIVNKEAKIPALMAFTFQGQSLLVSLYWLVWPVPCCLLFSFVSSNLASVVYLLCFDFWLTSHCPNYQSFCHLLEFRGSSTSLSYPQGGAVSTLYGTGTQGSPPSYAQAVGPGDAVGPGHKHHPWPPLSCLPHLPPELPHTGNLAPGKVFPPHVLSALTSMDRYLDHSFPSQEPWEASSV